MKICQISAVDFTIKHFLLPLIDKMKNEDWEVKIVCSKGKETDLLKSKGYDIRNIEIPRKLNIILLIKSVFDLFKEFKSEKYDVIHVHTPVASVVARIAAYFANIPIVIYSAHGFYFHENMPKIKYYFYLFIEKIFAKFTDIMFVQSEEDFKVAKKFNFIDKKKLFLIGNGVDIKKFNPKNINQVNILKNKLNLPKNSFVIGCIARLVEEKGIVEFLNVANKIVSNFSNVYFVLIGERLDSDHDNNINFVIKQKKYKMKNKLYLLGYREDVPDLLSIMDLFCLPSWREGLSRSIIEAMMMSKPVLTTNIRGCREQVEHNKTGLIVPQKSEIDLYNGMKFFIINKEKSILFGKRGRLKALKYFNEEDIVAFQIKTIKEHEKFIFIQ